MENDDLKQKAMNDEELVRVKKFEKEQEDQERDLERQEELDEEYGDSYECMKLFLL